MHIIYNKEKKEIPDNSNGITLAQTLQLTGPDQALAMKVNGNLYDLSHTLKNNDEVSFLSFADEEGKKVFWHTSAHVLAQAIERLYPEAKKTIGPSIEQGFYYDFANLTISDADFKAIETEIKKIIEENHKPVRKVYKNKQEAIKAYPKNSFKKELIEQIPDGEEISYYEQGEYYDVCRGPHLPSLSKIKAFKVTKTSGAYWRGDQKNEMLTRIYGISFPDKKLLQDYLKFLEEAKERDHKRLGQLLDLYSFHDEAPGMPFIHPKGMFIWNTLIDFMRKIYKEENYEEIRTPIVLNKALWERSGHWGYYRDNMYSFEIEKGEVAIKPMNCPGSILYYESKIHSYRELPLRIAEIGLVHRHEASGALNGLFRVRCFHQDDAHHYMKKEDIKSEIFSLLKLMANVYMTFGLSYHLELSTRPAKSVGSDEDWDLSTKGLKEALDEYGLPYKINEGDGAFYGPKIDIHIKDALGRTWQCGTIQLDMNLPERFGLEYVDHDGGHKRPIMIHRVIYGSLERFFGVLVEHFAGKFPLWLSPIGIRVITVADRHQEYAETLVKKLSSLGFTVDGDFSNESVGKKIRNAQILKINYMLTVGDTESNNKTISLRTRDNVVHGEMQLDHFIEKIKKEKEEKSLLSAFVTP
jgi:threonyl-tRNA synthetase